MSALLIWLDVARWVVTYRCIDTNCAMYILVYTYGGIMAKPANLTIQQWGHSLAVRIPAAIARSAHLSVGQPVEVSLDEAGIRVRAIGAPKLSLTQKLALFDPVVHGGEVMATAPIGAEEM